MVIIIAGDVAAIPASGVGGKPEQRHGLTADGSQHPGVIGIAQRWNYERKGYRKHHQNNQQFDESYTLAGATPYMAHTNYDALEP